MERKSKFVNTLAVMGIIIASVCLMPKAEAQDEPKNLTADELIGMLQNRAPGGITADELTRLQQNRLFVEKVGKKAAKGEPFTMVEKKRLADIVRQPEYAKVDLEVFFPYDSATITREAAHTLAELGRALSGEKLKRNTFFLGGHTDAKGSDEYNKVLSERRAQSVKRFLASNFRIDPGRLIATGYGEENLKNLYNPEAAENRRVQIVNMTR